MNEVAEMTEREMKALIGRTVAPLSDPTVTWFTSVNSDRYTDVGVKRMGRWGWMLFGKLRGQIDQVREVGMLYGAWRTVWRTEIRGRYVSK